MSDELLTTDQVINATAGPILEYGRAWMLDAETAAAAAELGLVPGFGFWVNGRAGFLGDADPAVAAATIGFMALDTVAVNWGVRNNGVTMPDITVRYAESLGRFGQRTLGSIEASDLTRLADLARTVADAALPSIGVLFAGWRALPRPTDPAADAALALNVLRELRGGAHLSAVNAVGLGPHGAIMSAPDPVRGGLAGAERFGWPAPHPEPDHQARTRAESLTDDICRPAFDVLDQAERADLVQLVELARSTI
jgi:hypothetical protein